MREPFDAEVDSACRGHLSALSDNLIINTLGIEINLIYKTA